jgi:Zn-dependent metalloprotease
MKTNIPIWQILALDVLAALTCVPTPSLRAADHGDASDAPAPRAERRQVAPLQQALDAGEALKQESGSEVSATWSHRGVARALYGDLGRYGDASEASARRFLAEHGAAFKLRPDLADLTLVDTKEIPGGTRLRFQEDYLGVKVYGASMSVCFGRDGKVAAAGGDYCDSILLDSVTPALGVDDARARLLEHLNRGDEPPAALDELVVYVDDAGVAHLAYHLLQPTTNERGAAETFEAFVDASDGSLAGEPRDVNEYATARVYHKGNAMAATGDTTLEDSSTVPDSAYWIVTLPRLTSSTYLKGRFVDCASLTDPAHLAVADADGNFLSRRSRNLTLGSRFDAQMAYFYIDSNQAYVQNTLGFNDANNRSTKIDINGTSDDNAWYTLDGNGTGPITLGFGGVDDGEDAESILHEYGHAIQDNMAPNMWEGLGTAHFEAGTKAMGEGFSDYWACSYTSSHFNQAGTPFETLQGEWNASAFSNQTPPRVRAVVSTKHYPEDVDGEVHDDGEIWSATLWQIRGDLGVTRTDRLVLESNFFVFSPNATFTDGAHAVLTAAGVLGFSQADIDTVRHRFQQRGIL